MEIDHIGIAVRSIKESLCFYKSLGLIPSFETVSSERVKVAFLALNNKVHIELLEPTDSKSVIHKFLEKRGPGLHHICLRVKHLKTLLEKLQAQEIRLVDSAPRPGAGGSQVAFVHPSATSGVLVELSEKLK